MAEDRTSYSQSLTHMIKGNLGAGVLGMGSSFAHLGLAGAMITLPALCLISCHCVHLLIKSADSVGSASRSTESTSSSGRASSAIDYPSLARRGLGQGPSWMRSISKPLGQMVETTLLLAQIGCCCVYIVFVVDNVTSILASYHVHISKSLAFVCIFPITLLLSFIRTLKRLALASMAANLLQFIGLALIVEFLARDLSHVNLHERDNFRPLGEMALGFGSTMFAFEGIGVVLPIYSRMRRPKLMSTTCGVVNISYLVILILYFVVGLLSYLKYGHTVRDSITLNLPAEPLYDLVRAMFTASILLTYPLQFYVPNEMIWKWARENILAPPIAPVPADFKLSPLDVPQVTNEQKATLPLERTIEFVVAKDEHTKPQKSVALQLDASNLVKNKEFGLLGSLTLNADEKHRARIEQMIRDMQASASKAPLPLDERDPRQETETNPQKQPGQDKEPTDEETRLVRYEYYCRLAVVLTTFTLAASVPKLNLLMDLIGSFCGVILCLTMPAMIHLAVYWDHTKGFSKGLMIISDSLIIVMSLFAAMGGSISSMVSIIRGH